MKQAPTSDGDFTVLANPEMFGLLPLSVLGSNEPPLPMETHGPGVCQYCGEHRDALKTESRSQKSYCRLCAPGRETDADWPNVKALPQAGQK
jgi:hypothetical protein